MRMVAREVGGDEKRSEDRDAAVRAVRREWGRSEANEEKRDEE